MNCSVDDGDDDDNYNEWTGVGVIYYSRGKKALLLESSPIHRSVKFLVKCFPLDWTELNK